MKIKRLITENTHTIEIKFDELNKEDFYATKVKHVHSEAPLRLCYYKIVKPDGNYKLHDYWATYEEITAKVKFDWNFL